MPDDFTVTGDELDRCLDRAEKAEAERDRYRDALDSLVEALSAVDVSGQIGDVEDYDEALRSAHEAFAPDERREQS